LPFAGTDFFRFCAPWIAGAEFPLIDACQSEADRAAKRAPLQTVKRGYLPIDQRHVVRIKEGLSIKAGDNRLRAIFEVKQQASNGKRAYPSLAVV
jgi:hypothetical protein